MADILIQNLVLPVVHPLTITIHPDGEISMFGIKQDVKAIELPHHGTLKDTDAIMHELSNRKFIARTHNDNGVADGYMYAIEMIDDAPTIVEAST